VFIVAGRAGWPMACPDPEIRNEVICALVQNRSISLSWLYHEAENSERQSSVRVASSDVPFSTGNMKLTSSFITMYLRGPDSTIFQ
jgi:hypothetical protein